MKLFVIAIAVFGISSGAYGHSSGRDCKKHYQPCAADKCCCSRKTAVCDGTRGKLTYIPVLTNAMRSLELSNNILPSLTKSGFNNITSLTLGKLIIKSNEVVNVSEDAFDDLRFLRRLELIDNKEINMSQLAAAIGRQIKLKTLYLNAMGISGNIPQTLMNELNGLSVDTLSFDNNNISHINIDNFENVTKLKYLLLNSNAITDITATKVHPKLQILRLRNNMITKYPPQFCTSNRKIFPSLVYLNLANNFIRLITPSHFDCLTNLRKLDISGNVLAYIPDNIISNLKFLVDFRASQSMVVQGRKSMIGNYACKSTSLKRLNLDSNNIVFDSEHVKNHFFGQCKHLTYLNVDNNNMMYLVEKEMVQLLSPLTKLERLYLNGNRLKTIPTDLLKKLTNLNFLSVNNNFVHDIGQFLLGSIRLRHLSAYGNRIGVVRPESFPESVRNSLRKINLAKNPLVCSCENRWFRNWVGETGKPIGTNITLNSWPSRYNCYSPRELHDKQFITYRPTEALCRTVSISLVIIASAGSMVLIIGFGFIIGMRFRWQLMYCWYKLNNSKVAKDPETGPNNQEPYTYVVYHDEDSSFVHNTLINIIEHQFELKLFVWHRDADHGARASIMIDAIESSENVLVVISNDFTKDGWCEFQLELGLLKKNTTRKDCLTLLLVEDLDLGSLRRSWCVTLVKNATITWRDDAKTVQGKLCRDRLKTRLSSTKDEYFSCMK